MLPLTKSPNGDDLAHHAVAKRVLADHLELVGGARRQPVDSNLGASGRRHGNGGPFGHPRLSIPDGVVLFVVGPAAVAGKPAEGNGELGGRAREVVGRVRLGALHHQLRGRDDGGHLVGGDALVEAEVGATQGLDGDVAADDFYSVLRQGTSCSRRSAHFNKFVTKSHINSMTESNIRKNGYVKYSSLS